MDAAISELLIRYRLSGFVDTLVYPLVMRQYRDLTRSHPRPPPPS